MTGLTLTDQEHADPDATVTVGPEHLTSPRDLQRELWRPDHHDLADELLRALHQLVADVPRSSRRATLAQEFDVTALSHEADGRQYTAYAQLAAYALDTMPERARFIQVTRYLGSMTDYGQSSLDDVGAGPIAILDAAEVAPLVEIHLDGFGDLKSNQRESVLRYLCRLTPGVDVSIIGSKLALRKLLSAHADLLPASVTERTESALIQTAHVATRSEKRREDARTLLAEKGEDHPDWRRLKALSDRSRERARYDTFVEDTIADFVSRDALKQWVSRMSEHDLVEACGPMHDREVRLLPTGHALLAEHPQIAVDPSRRGAGRTDVQPASTADGSQRSQSAAVSDPPKSPDSPVYSPTATGGVGDRPADEPHRTADSGSSPAARDRLSVGYLDGWEHDAAVSMAQPGEIALCDRPANTEGDSREASWSFLEERDEVVVRVEASAWGALTMLRLCSALLPDPAFQQVLTPNRLAGGEDRDGLAGLPIDNPYVLRNGACLGWLRNQDADAKAFRRRLRQARDALEQYAAEIAPIRDASDEETGQLLREAHGLAGVAIRLYDMLGLDVTRVVDVPDWAVDDADRRQHLTETLAKQTAISSRYGVYSANRVLYEPREDKRDQLLGAPDVDAAEPTGDVCGSWVLVGDNVDMLRPDLESMTEHLVLQRDEDNFAPFEVPINLVDGGRRSAYATTIARRATLRSMETTRKTTSVLRGLTSDPFAAAKALHHLGTESEIPREMDLVDVRVGLSHLDPSELLPEIGSTTVSRAVHALLDAEESLSTAALADAIGRTTQTLRNNSDAFDQLEATGLLERNSGGAGQATRWRLRLPFSDERRQSEALNPTLCVDTTASTDDWIVEDPLAALAEALFELDTDIDYGSEMFVSATSRGGDLRPLLRQHPDLAALLRLVLELVGADLRTLPVSGSVRRSENTQLTAGLVDEQPQITMGLDPSPNTTQQRISAASD